MDAVLSTLNVAEGKMGSVRSGLLDRSSTNNLLIHNTVLAHEESAMYSASVKERETIVFRYKLHTIGDPLISPMKPVVDFRVSRHPAQSASQWKFKSHPDTAGYFNR